MENKILNNNLEIKEAISFKDRLYGLIGNKNINIATIMVGTIIPDLMSVIAIPCSIFIKGPDLNSIYNFFDQTLI